MTALAVGYDDWNVAIADVLFPERAFPEPVYLDIEDDELVALGEAVGLPSNEVEQALCESVRATLDLRRPADAFRQHQRAVAAWSTHGRQEGEPPPVLALLAVFSLAAERMAASDGLVSHNFYGRLRECLRIDPDIKEIEDAYRGVAEQFWGALNKWLTDMNGRRGIPTAFAVSHRYVGLSVSQALIRKTDRDRLVSFFQSSGLAPGMELSPGALEPLFDAWISREPSPASKHLQRLWANEASRERVANAVALELANWDGSVKQQTGEESGTARVALSAEIGGFPKKRFRLQALLYTARPETARHATLRSSSGDTQVPLVPTSAGALAVGGASEFNNASLLEGTLSLVDTGTGATATRQPRRLVAFRQDELTRRWIEADAVLLGEDVTLLARRDLSGRLEPILKAAARPGWTVTTDGLPGLPDGWSIYRGVQLFRHPGERAERIRDFAPLVPLTTSQLELAGGLSLPFGRRNVWHTAAPPELRAVSDTPEGFAVTLIDLGEPDSIDDPATLVDTGIVLEQWSDNGTGSVIASIADAELEDGDYRLQLAKQSDGTVLAVRHFALRTADHPDPRQWQLAPTVVQHLSDPVSVIGACGSGSGPELRGALVPSAASSTLETAPLSRTPWWNTEKGASSSSFVGVLLPRAEPDSCLYTGSHRFDLDTPAHDKQGRPIDKNVSGRCGQCGLERRYSTSYHRNRRHHSRKSREAAEHVDVDVAALPVANPDDGRRWDTAFDALQYLSGGRFPLFERVARQIESTGLFVDQFLRSLESLGHVEPRRDPHTLAPAEWEVTPTELVATRNGYLLLGYWPQSLRDALSDALTEVGGTLESRAQPDGDGPVSWFARGGHISDAARAVDENISVLDRGWRPIAEHLPALSAVLRALPRRPAELTGHVKRFSVPHARWVDAVSYAEPGAYRLSTFATFDFIRTGEDVERGEIAVSVVQLSKHGAALVEGTPPLLAYNPATEELSVPLGSDLPGLYGRAAVLCSGLLPTARGRLLTYHQVPPELAAHLAYLLTH